MDSPLSKYARTVGEVVDRVDAEDRVEGTAFERKLGARVCLKEGRPPLQGSFVCESGPLRDRLVVELDADDLALCQARYAQARTARAAANVQQARRRLELEPRYEPLEFVQGEPAVLADILSERRAADLRVDLCGELPVMSTVMVYNLWPLSHTPSLRTECNVSLIDHWEASEASRPVLSARCRQRQ